MVQIFEIFADRLASAKIKTAKFAASAISIALCFRMRAGAVKIKFLLAPAEAIPRNFAPTKISRYTVSRDCIGGFNSNIMIKSTCIKI